MKAPNEYPVEAGKVFTFRLARDLGMTVAELERRLSTREFAEWAAFYAAEGKEIEAARKKAEQKARRR
jgi:hypothetical protein